MDKKIAGILGAAAALTAVSGGAQAAAPAQELQPAATYRDLLEPIPNAVALLKNEDSQGSAASASGQMRVAQHHHHHHHRWRRHHHHHHHHHHRYHHHHHHHY